MRPLTRPWFRWRLEKDPRRWVLLLSALEGFAGFAVKSADRPLFFKTGISVLSWLVFAALAPGLGVLAMLAHGRVLWWTGKLLGGRARPYEIHAAFAWSELPFLVAAAPLVLGTLLRAMAHALDPVPPAPVQFGMDLLNASADVLELVAVAGALAGMILYVRFLGEAQGFRTRRAVANHLLAAVAGLGILFGSIAIGVWFVSGLAGALAGLAIAALVAVTIEWWVQTVSRRLARAIVPTGARRS